MKSLLLFISAVCCVPTASAQFNTHTPRREIRRIYTDLGTQQHNPPVVGKVAYITDRLPNILVDNEIPLHIVSGISEQEDYNKWVKQYLIVSLPLDRIEVSFRFGTRKDPFTGKISRHSGLDLRARYDKVYNIMYGVVVKVASDRCAGKYISVRYGDYVVSYCHLSRQLAQKGMNVLPGEVIGVSGNTRRSTGPYLHLTVR